MASSLKKRGFVLALCFFLFPLTGAVAEEESEILFGPEFTFSNRLMVLEGAVSFGDIPDLPVSRHYRRKMVNWIKRNCQGCTVEEIANPSVEHRQGLERMWHNRIKHYRVTYPNGFWFTVIPDPGVVEVIAKPSTRAEFLAMKDTLQRDIWGAAKAAGMAPNPVVGGGHLNVGFESAFGDNRLLFRNFLVDMVNNPEFNEQKKASSWHVHDLSAEKQAEFARAIEEFDRGKIGTVEELADRIIEKVYPEGKEGRYVALALHYLRDRGRYGEPLSRKARRLELRAIQAQQNMTEFLLETEIIEAKIRQHSRNAEPIPLRIPDSDRTPEQSERRFHAWLREAGLEPSRFGGLSVPRNRRLDTSLGKCAHLLGFVGNE